MSDLIQCPYCGRVMELMPKAMFLPEFPDMKYWYWCPGCKSSAPVRDTPEDALAAARQRHTPPAQPLTLAELVEHEMPWPLWVEVKSRRQQAAYSYVRPSVLVRLQPSIKEGTSMPFAEFADSTGRRLDLYGKLWRCWLEKPTGKELLAAPWSVKETEKEITRQDIDDIMVAALEGGINHWCGSVSVVGELLGEYASDQISRGGSLILYDLESPAKWVLTPDNFSKGLKLYFERIGKALDASDIDADAADQIIQLALFGEIVFG